MNQRLVKVASVHISELGSGVGVEVAVTASNFTEWNVDVSVKTAAIPLAFKAIICGPGNA